VYHHTIGLPGNSQASMPILAGEAMNTPARHLLLLPITIRPKTLNFRQKTVHLPAN
jgi:hypothetical protein